MKAEWKEKWLIALRSGDYQQGKQQLKKENGEPKYCCLGVLCDIHPDVNWKGERAHHLAFESLTMLPSALERVLEIKPTHVRNVVYMNDSGDSFRTIATYIEEMF